MSNRVVVTINLITQTHETSVAVPPTMKANSAESDLLSQINSEKLIPDVGPAISSQLAEVAKRYWVEEYCKVPVVAKIAERLNMPSNCNFAVSKVSKLSEGIANNKKSLTYHKREDKRLTDIQKSISLAISPMLQMSNVLQCQQQPFELKKFVSLSIDVITVLGTANHPISAERKDELKPALN